MASWSVQASYLSTVRNTADFTVEATDEHEALAKAEALLEASGGEDTDLIQWEAHDNGWDGEYECEVEEDI